MMTKLLALASALVALGSSAATTYYNLLPDYSGKREVDGIATVTNPDAWATGDGETAGAITADKYFRITQKRALSLPNASDAASSFTFNGHSLTLGISGGSTGSLNTYCKGDCIPTFANEGLELVNGAIDCEFTANNGGEGTIDGKVTVKAKEAAPFQIRWSYTGSKGAHLKLTGDLSGAETAWLQVGGRASSKKPVTTNNTLRLSGDTSGYLGHIVVTSDFARATYDLFGVGLLGKSTLPGITEVKAGAVVQPLTKSDTLTFGTLNLRDGAAIRIPMSVTAGADGFTTAISAGKVVVTGTLSAERKVRLLVGSLGLTTVAVDIPVLTFPISSGLGDDDIVLDCPNGSVSLKIERGAETCTVSLVSPAFVYQTVSDPASIKNAANSTSSMTNEANWYVRGIPEKGRDYLVTKVNKTMYLHTPGGNRTGGDHAFGGDSLTIDDGCFLIGYADTFAIPRLCLLDGAYLAQGQFASMTLTGDELRIPFGEVSIQSMQNNLLTIDMPLSGAGEILMDGVTSTGSPLGRIRFAKPSPNFRGRIHLAQKDNTSSGAIVSPTFDKGFQTLQIDDQMELGGKLDDFDPSALFLERFGTLQAVETFTIDTSMNRGIFVSGADYGGGLDVVASKELTLATQLTMDGVLYKKGAGTLTLAGTVRFGADQSETPSATKNVLDVREGTLKLASATACDGLAVSFAAGTALAVKPNLQDAELTRWGARNVKADTPFALQDGLTELPISVDADDAFRAAILASANPVRIGLVTVSSGAAAGFRTIFGNAKLSCRVRGCSCKSVEIVDDSTGAVTFAFEYKPTGFSITLR